MKFVFSLTSVSSSAMCMAVSVCNVMGPVLTLDWPLARAIKITNCRIQREQFTKRYVYNEERKPHQTAIHTLLPLYDAEMDQ